MKAESCDLVIAVDPGQEPAYAIARRVGRSAFCLDLVAQTDMRQVFGVLARYSATPRRGLAIEDQFIGIKNHLLGLIRNAERWVAYAELLGYATRRYAPNAWISRAVSGRCCRMATDARKSASRERCSELGLPTSRLSHDQCDAVCIALAALDGARLICSHVTCTRH